MKYAAHFPVSINYNRTISLFDTGATVPCMSKSCFDKLQPQQKLVKTKTYRVHCAEDNSPDSIGMTKCTLDFPKKFHPTIHCENYLNHVILDLDFSPPIII